MTYHIDYTDKAVEGLIRLRESEPKAYAKVQRLIDELREHPKTGTGKPEQLKGDRAGQWSRRITGKHRLVYAINDAEVVVLVLTAYGHYKDK
ncbi:MAG: Txe/YoeB family addiction module toxin [Prevotella sp.]|nr:Txe/YoeB family addiction module toxin [Prevotella sp.]MBR1464473.1 Txe/YoeB family addiction module toxin [Prevotella sp.]